MKFYQKKFKKTNQDKEIISNSNISCKILKFPLIFKLPTVALLIFCVFINLYILIFQLEDWPYLLILNGFFGIPSLIMFICWSVWKVEIYKEGFLYRNFIGKKIYYKYENLEYREHYKGLKWYFYKEDKKVFCMPYYIENGNSLSKMYRKYRNKNVNQ